MNREEKWNDFMNTGRVEDYLAYRNAVKDEGEDTFQGSYKDREKKDNKDAEFSNGNGNGN